MGNTQFRVANRLATGSARLEDDAHKPIKPGVGRSFTLFHVQLRHARSNGSSFQRFNASALSDDTETVPMGARDER